MRRPLHVRLLSLLLPLAVLAGGLGGASFEKFLRTGLSGPQSRDSRLVWRGAKYFESHEFLVPRSRIKWPTGIERVKGLFGQRVLR